MTTVDRAGSADILRGTAGVLEVVLSVDGAPTDPDASPAPSVTVVDGVGAVLAGPIAATIVGAGSGKLRLVLTPVQTAEVNDLAASWTFSVSGTQQSATTYHRVAGDVLFTLGEARGHDGGALASPPGYSNDAILAARDRIAEAFAEICGVAFGTRCRHEVLDGTGTATLQLSALRVSAVRSVEFRTFATGTWTPLTEAELADLVVHPTGRIVRESLGTLPAGRGNVRVAYEHGWQPIPAEIRLAALRLVRAQLVASNLDDRATSQSSELGTFALATAGRSGSYFGLPLVDEVLNRFRAERLPVMA